MPRIEELTPEQVKAMTNRSPHDSAVVAASMVGNNNHSRYPSEFPPRTGAFSAMTMRAPPQQTGTMDRASSQTAGMSAAYGQALRAAPGAPSRTHLNNQSTQNEARSHTPESEGDGHLQNASAPGPKVSPTDSPHPNSQKRIAVSLPAAKPTKQMKTDREGVPGQSHQQNLLNQGMIQERQPQLPQRQMRQQQQQQQQMFGENQRFRQNGSAATMFQNQWQSNLQGPWTDLAQQMQQYQGSFANFAANSGGPAGNNASMMRLQSTGSAGTPNSAILGGQVGGSNTAFLARASQMGALNVARAPSTTMGCSNPPSTIVAAASAPSSAATAPPPTASVSGQQQQSQNLRLDSNTYMQSTARLKDSASAPGRPRANSTDSDDGGLGARSISPTPQNRHRKKRAVPSLPSGTSPFHFGHPKGSRFVEGRSEPNRRKVVRYGGHISETEDISGSSLEGCDSILVDKPATDRDDLCIFPLPCTNKHAIRILIKSRKTKRPIRIFRKEDEGEPSYRYDGLYTVIAAVDENGKFLVDVPRNCDRPSFVLERNASGRAKEANQLNGRDLWGVVSGKRRLQARRIASEERLYESADDLE